MYATLTQAREYLGMKVAETGDDALITSLIARAQRMIDAHVGYGFEASADTTEYYSAVCDVFDRALMFGKHCSLITSVVNGDGSTIAASQYFPVLITRDSPLIGIKLKTSTGLYWTYITDHEQAISVTGRWAYMDRALISTMTRATNVVTVTTTTPHLLRVGAKAYVSGASDSGFDGAFTVASVPSESTFTFAQTAANASTTGGTCLSIPADVEQATLRLVAFLYRQRDNSSDIDRPVLTSDGVTIMPSNLPQDVQQLLRNYARTVRI